MARLRSAIPMLRPARARSRSARTTRRPATARSRSAISTPRLETRRSRSANFPPPTAPTRSSLAGAPLQRRRCIGVRLSRQRHRRLRDGDRLRRERERGELDRVRGRGFDRGLRRLDRDRRGSEKHRRQPGRARDDRDDLCAARRHVGGESGGAKRNDLFHHDRFLGSYRGVRLRSAEHHESLCGRRLPQQQCRDAE
jgi:hypothetical protein